MSRVPKARPRGKRGQVLLHPSAFNSKASQPGARHKRTDANTSPPSTDKQPAWLVRSYVLSKHCTYSPSLRLIIVAIVECMWDGKTRWSMGYGYIAKCTGLTAWTIGRQLNMLEDDAQPILRRHRHHGRDVWEFEIDMATLSKVTAAIADSQSARATPEWLTETWNAAAREHTGLRAATVLSDTRRRRVAQLLRSVPSRAHWTQVIERIAASKFCTGQIAGRDGRVFHADFDFLTKPDTHVKVLEGKYRDDDKAASGNRRNGNGRARIYRDDETIAPVKITSVSND